MLLELRVENLLLIEGAHLRLGPGLNVLTGETGAGKTVLAQALDLLLGGRARGAVVRPGAGEAYVEGVFALPAALREECGERLPVDAGEVVLARRVTPDGRTRAYLNGRSATVGDLRELGAQLIAFYGQHEHRKLTLASAQLDILDHFAGEDALARRRACGVAHREVRAHADRLRELLERAGERERERDLLAFELSEIKAVDPAEEEHAELLARRGRLRGLEALRSAAAGGEAALRSDGSSDALGASELLAAGLERLEAAADTDPALDALTARMRTLALETDDLAGELDRYRGGLDSEPGELEALEERLAAIERLVRKHGGSVTAVLDYAERCRSRLALLDDTQTSREETEHALARARATLAEAAQALSAARREAAPRLAAAVRERLEHLAMAGASFEVELTDLAEPGPSGAEHVELVIAPNPGVPAGPLREIASGGELSRVMLALMGVANAGAEVTLVFDEVDAGIGGQTARAVGAQLQELAEGRQVLCITHLPQIASLAARHFSVAKDQTASPTRTTVTELAEAQVVGELVRMLGADADDDAARRHARELRKAA